MEPWFSKCLSSHENAQLDLPVKALSLRLRNDLIECFDIIEVVFSKLL